MDDCITGLLSKHGFLVEILADGQAILPVNRKRLAGERALLSERSCVGVDLRMDGRLFHMSLI